MKNSSGIKDNSLIIKESVLISVIMPCFNNGLFLNQSIESVLNQTHKKIELIIIDDCSNDNSVSIIKSYNDNRIVFLRNEQNLGAAASRNRGIQKANGDYIAFLDADDYWSSDKLEKQLEFMISNNFSFAGCEYFIVRNNSISKYVTAPLVITHKKLLQTNYIGCLTVMFKKDICPNLSIPESIIKRNDYALWLKLTEISPCYILKEKLAYYRKQSNNSLSSGNRFKLFGHHYQMFKLLYDFSSLKCWFYSLRNAVFTIFKKLFYIKKV